MRYDLATAMDAIEKDDSLLTGAFVKDCAHSPFSKCLR